MASAVSPIAPSALRYFFSATQINCPIREIGSISAQTMRLFFSREEGRGHFLHKNMRLHAEQTR